MCGSGTTQVFTPSLELPFHPTHLAFLIPCFPQHPRLVFVPFLSGRQCCGSHRLEAGGSELGLPAQLRTVLRELGVSISITSAERSPQELTFPMAPGSQARCPANPEPRAGRSVPAPAPPGKRQKTRTLAPLLAPAVPGDSPSAPLPAAAPPRVWRRQKLRCGPRLGGEGRAAGTPAAPPAAIPQPPEPAADRGAALTWQPEAQQQAVVDDGRVPQAAAIAVVRQEGAVVEVEVVVLHRPALPARRRPPAPHALGAGGAAPAAGGTGTGTGTSRSAPGRAAQGRGAGRGRGQPQPQPQPLPQAARPRPPAPPLPPAGRGPPAPGGGTAAAEARRDEERRRAPGTAGGLESSELFPH